MVQDDATFGAPGREPTPTPEAAPPIAADFMSSIMARLTRQDKVQKTTNDQLAALIAALTAPDGQTSRPQQIRCRLFNTNPTATGGDHDDAPKSNGEGDSSADKEQPANHRRIEVILSQQTLSSDNENDDTHVLEDLRDVLAYLNSRALYNTIIRTKDPTTSSVLPFSTSFTSLWLLPKMWWFPAIGIVFLFAPSIGINGTSSAQHLGGSLQLDYNGDPTNPIFGVEFDVFADQEFCDIDANQAGIDVNSVFSNAFGFWSVFLSRRSLTIVGDGLHPSTRPIE
ncbi:hypothetical protein F2Q69_00052152 [Brassica cretica]|uniref:Legume lectin domain-containing protein n=1 Tax=Brassica cretica TaxID=69181 RepID=A0A8S9MX77_BRACR|nr:hypothetical protein F2Q69_00052152 [Brassica cretica]